MRGGRIGLITLLLGLCTLVRTEGYSLPAGMADSLLWAIARDSVVGGWSLSERPREFEGEGLFDLIDGGAPLFFEYGFRSVVTAEYRSLSGATISAEVYRMNDAGGAYGIYSLRSGERGTRINLGQVATQHPGYVMFWQGTFYVSVVASDSGAESVNGMNAVGRAIEGMLTGTGSAPKLIEFLPRERLQKTWYVRGTLALSALLMAGEEESAGMMDGVVGKYEGHRLHLLRYTGANSAQSAARRWRERMQSAGGFSEYQSKEGLTSARNVEKEMFCLAQVGPYLILVASPDQTTAETACREMAASDKLR